jgi:hypothetical protein
MGGCRGRGRDLSIGKLSFNFPFLKLTGFGDDREVRGGERWREEARGMKLEECADVHIGFLLREERRRRRCFMKLVWRVMGC